LVIQKKEKFEDEEKKDLQAASVTTRNRKNRRIIAYTNLKNLVIFSFFN
jgi:hypothetical protein